MSTIVAVCPYCRAGGVKAPASAVGSSANCPRCGSSFTVMPSEGVPGWATKSPSGTVAAPPAAETQPSAALPDVTEPSPVVPAEPPPEPKAKKAKHGETHHYRALADSLGRAVEFTGYDEVVSEATVRGILSGAGSATSAREGEEVEVVLDRTPFYAEGGGQLADQGVIELENGHVVRDQAQGVYGHQN